MASIPRTAGVKKPIRHILHHEEQLLPPSLLPPPLQPPEKEWEQRASSTLQRQASASLCQDPTRSSQLRRQKRPQHATSMAPQDDEEVLNQPHPTLRHLGQEELQQEPKAMPMAQAAERARPSRSLLVMTASVPKQSKSQSL